MNRWWGRGRRRCVRWCAKGREAGFYADYRDGKYAAWGEAVDEVRAETEAADVIAVPEAIHAETFSTLSGRRVVRDGDLAALGGEVGLVPGESGQGWAVERR